LFTLGISLKAAMGKNSARNLFSSLPCPKASLSQEFGEFWEHRGAWKYISY
jgi:hypothetical protein